MNTKIIIQRRVPDDRVELLRPLLQQLRSLAMAQPGYISGETLINADDPQEVLVISTWDSLEHWDAWLASGERAALQAQVDAITGQETLYQVYYNG